MKKIIRLYKENGPFLTIIILVILLCPFIVNFIVTTESPLGFINSTNRDAWISFFGALIGGAMTLIGVWWTIKDQDKKRKEDQENRDKEKNLELAIQYKPIPYMNAYRQIDDRGNKIFPIQKNKEEGFNFVFCLHVTNKGRGEIVCGKIISYNIKSYEKGLNINYSKDLHFIPVNETDYYPFVIENITNLNQDIEISFKYEYTDLLGKEKAYVILIIMIKLVNNSNPINPNLTIIDTDASTQYFL